MPTFGCIVGNRNPGIAMFHRAQVDHLFQPYVGSLTGVSPGRHMFGIVGALAHFQQGPEKRRRPLPQLEGPRDPRDVGAQHAARDDVLQVPEALHVAVRVGDGRPQLPAIAEPDSKGPSWQPTGKQCRIDVANNS